MKVFINYEITFGAENGTIPHPDVENDRTDDGVLELEVEITVEHSREIAGPGARPRARGVGLHSMCPAVDRPTMDSNFGPNR